MKAVTKLKQLPDKIKRQLMAALLVMCAIATFAVPAFGGGYNILKTEKIKSSAAVTDVDLLLVASSAFGEARKAMNATNPDAQEQFIKNITSLVGGSSGYKWHNMGLLLGPKDALSGSTWNVFQNPTTLSLSEAEQYKDENGNNGFKIAYEKYKAFGYAVEDLNIKAKKSHSSTVSTKEGLDSMSSAALKLGNFGVKFLNDYNPAPVVLSLYDSSNLSTYADNKLVKLVKNNVIMKEVITLFGDKVGNTGISFFLLLNAVIAVVGLAISMLLSVLGNQSIGDGIRKFILRIIIGTVGMYLIGNFMSVMLDHVSNTVLNEEAAEDVSYIEKNLNLYDWYLTGFSLPSGTTLTIDKSGRFELTAETIKAINQYTYKRVTGSNNASANKIRKRMEDYTENENNVIASFVTPTYNSGQGENGESGEAWATDVYYKVMENFAGNKDLADNDATGSTTFSLYSSRYLWMSGLSMTANGNKWNVSMYAGDNYYGLNPISAFNLLRTEFSGDNITATSTVYPSLAYVAYDAVNVKDTTGEGSKMNSILRFIAIFTIIMAALKGMITIFTAGFGGILSGGIKTATGSSYGLGQALGGVVAIFGGLIGISLILSITMTLLEAVYGIAYDLISGAEIIDAILTPIEDAVGDIPLIGDLIMEACEGIVSLLLTLIFSLTFPKLGGIPINVFCQYMADIPGRIGERAQMIEGMFLTGRSSAGGGPGPRPGGGGRGAYGHMAAAQASQAFGSAQRQAVGVISGVAGAAAALGGAGLTAAGKALNKKADTAEGKPKNPGMDNWDDLSPEQQTAAAAAAEDLGEDWENMDQDAREKAMQDRMEAEEANAQEASGADGENPDGETPDGEDSVAGNALGGEEAGPDAGAEDMGDASVSEGAEGSSDGADGADAGEPAEGLEDQSLNGGDGDGNAPGTGDAGSGDQSLGGDTAGEENVVNNNNEQESIGMEQKVNNDIKSDADARNVDNSSINEDGDKDIEGAVGSDKDPAKDGTKMAGAASSMNDKNSPDKAAGDKAGGASSMTANVQNSQTTNAKNNMTANKKAQSVDKSKTTSMNTGAGKGTGQGAGKSPGSSQSTGQGLNQSAQGMNGTSKSRYGKEMSVQEQRKARIMHAVGDGLQMAGGNRSVGDGLRDAAGHMKDAAANYVVSDDVLPTLTTSVRERRREREARMRRNRNNGGGVNQ